MMSILTIGLFFLYCWGLGYTATYFLSKPENVGERQFLLVGIGLGVFPILAVLLNFLHIPLDWKIFLGLSLILPLYVLGRKIQKKEFKLPSLKLRLTKSSLFFLAVLLIFAFSLFMYTKGAFSYPYLEDEDPWGHSVGVKYVAVEKNAYDPPVSVGEGRIDIILSYIDPYPPAYDILMGILHQTSADLQWTLKFFNALIISLSFIFFYLFAKEFTGSPSKSLMATFILASLPAYLSHFIWAHALGMVIFFPTLYVFLKIRLEKKWWWLATVLVASIWVTQNFEQPIKLTVLLGILLIVTSIISRKWIKEEFYALGGGVTLSLLWWGTMVAKYSPTRFIKYYTGEGIISNTVSVSGVAASSSLVDKLQGLLHALTSAGGSGSRAYLAQDFFLARGENAINNPIGIGLVVAILVLTGVFYLLWKYRSALIEEKNRWLCITLLWLILLFWGVNGQTFPISILRGPFRVWMYLAIPVALLAAETSFMFSDYFHRWKIPRMIVWVLLIVGIVITSFIPKYQVNTSIWPTSGSFTSATEPWEYGAWFNSIPPNSKVFLYAPRDKVAIGYGAFACAWCDDELQFRENILDQDVPTLHTFLKSKGYEYLIINGNMDQKYFKKSFGENKTAELLPQRYEEIQKLGLFTPVYYKEGVFLVMKVN